MNRRFLRTARGAVALTDLLIVIALVLSIIVLWRMVS